MRDSRSVSHMVFLAHFTNSACDWYSEGLSGNRGAAAPVQSTEACDVGRPLEPNLTCVAPAELLVMSCVSDVYAPLLNTANHCQQSSNALHRLEAIAFHTGLYHSLVASRHCRSPLPFCGAPLLPLLLFSELPADSPARGRNWLWIGLLGQGLCSLPGACLEKTICRN